MPDSLYLFDTVTLSNFALSNSLDLLVRRYEQRLLVTTEILSEVAAGVTAGHAALRAIAECVRARRFRQTSLDWQERVVFGELLGHLGAGEASCIAVACYRHGVVVTDDRAARACCVDRKIRFTGTVGILKASCLDGQITADEADEMLSAMVEHGFSAPVSKIRDILP